MMPMIIWLPPFVHFFFRPVDELQEVVHKGGFDLVFLVLGGLGSWVPSDTKKQHEQYERPGR